MDAKEFYELLKNRHLTIVCAESITAGLLASTIASISGASDILIGSIVTYNRKLKTAVLGVDPRVIDENTAESMETTVEMAYGLTKIYPAADILVAVTGVASAPTNDYPSNKKPGQIYVAVYYKNKMHKGEEILQIQETDRDTTKETDRNIIRKKAVEFIFRFIAEIIKE